MSAKYELDGNVPDLRAVLQICALECATTIARVSKIDLGNTSRPVNTGHEGHD